MAKKNSTRLAIPRAKVLEFNLSGKSIPMSASAVADDALLNAHFGGGGMKFDGSTHHRYIRDMWLALARGQDMQEFFKNYNL